MGAHFPAVELDNAIWFSILSRMSGFLWHSSKWACRFGRFLQYTSGLEVLACSLDTDLNYVITMLQLRPSLNHYVKLWQILGERCSNFLGVFSKTDFWLSVSGIISYIVFSFRRLAVSAALFLVVFDHFQICKICHYFYISS